jgi:hypothetical protein
MRDDRGNDCVPPEPVLMGVPDSSFVADRQLMAAPSAAARQHGAAILRFHPGTESMSLRALAIIGLKCTFRHGLSSLARRRTCRSIFETLLV